MSDILEEIKKSLEQDVDLTDEDYKAKNAAADDNTEAHGVKGRAPLSEAKRARRITTNYQGTMLNISLNILAAIDEQNKLISKLCEEMKKNE